MPSHGVLTNFTSDAGLLRHRLHDVDVEADDLAFSFCDSNGA